MNKLKINVVAGVLDIIGAVFGYLSPFIFVAAIADAIAEDLSTASGAGTLSVIIGIIILVVHIIGLVQSKKVNISITGHILGIIGSGLLVILGMGLAFVSAILLTIAAVFTLKQKTVA